MGSQEIRSFLGGRHKDDKGLYVSTGGFSKDARYEAERASIPLTLMDLDDLVTAILEHYEKMDADAQRLVPLRKLYWQDNTAPALPAAWTGRSAQRKAGP
jgi:restriction system protein